MRLWRALIGGRWSVLEKVDSDNRRWILASQNPQTAFAVRRLTARERKVLDYVAQGHSNKLIAYTIGSTAAAVGNLIARATRKLSVTNRAALIQLLARSKEQRS